MNALDVIRNNWFYSAAFDRLHNGNSWMLLTCGQTGTGKSYASMRLAYDLDVDAETGQHLFPLDASRILFEPADLIDFVRGKGTEKLPAGSFIILDESAVVLNAQRWYDFEVRAIGALTQTFRFRQLASIFVFPGAISFLSKQVRQLAHTILVMKSINKQAGLSYGDFRNLQTNVFSGKIYRHTPEASTVDGDVALENFAFHLPPKELIKAYEEKKEAFLNAYYDSLASELRAVKQGGWNKKVELHALYEKVLKEPTLYMDVNCKRFMSSVLRVKLDLTQRNALELSSTLNNDLKAKRIKV